MHQRKTHFRGLHERNINDANAVFFSDMLYKAYVVGIHMNCFFAEEIQMSYHNICLYNEVHVD